MLGRRLEALETTAEAAKNGSVKPIITDVTDKESLLAAAKLIRNENGYLNVLFANAGIVGPEVSDLYVGGKVPSVQQLQERLLSPPMIDFNKVLALNITGAFYTCAALLDLLDEGNKRAIVPQKSQIIITSSVAGFTRSPNSAYAYSTSKAAVVSLVKRLSTSFAPYKIRVNCLAPGLYPSEMTENYAWMQSDNPRMEGSLKKDLCPLERTGTEEEIGGLALFMTSRAGAYMNGNIQLTDGGRIAVIQSTY